MSDNLFDEYQPDDLADPKLTSIQPPKVRKKTRKAFKVKFVVLTTRWIEALQRSNSIATYRLAHIILVEEFKRSHRAVNEIVLSSVMAKMPRNTRLRAARELVKLDLIKLTRKGKGQAYRVLFLSEEKKVENRE